MTASSSLCTGRSREQRERWIIDERTDKIFGDDERFLKRINQGDRIEDTGLDGAGGDMDPLHWRIRDTSPRRGCLN